ncbi:DUF4321 domain-containing protein [Caloramator fervidus]|nr:DUF4321 domain-containing protein [Caloramator fervidus]
MLVFGLAGTLLGELLGKAIKVLAFLQKDYVIGLKPMYLDLKFFALTFGMTFKINMLTMLGMIIAFFIYKKM